MAEMAEMEHEHIWNFLWKRYKVENYINYNSHIVI